MSQLASTGGVLVGCGAGVGVGTGDPLQDVQPFTQALGPLPKQVYGSPLSQTSPASTRPLPHRLDGVGVGVGCAAFTRSVSGWQPSIFQTAVSPLRTLSREPHGFPPMTSGAARAVPASPKSASPSRAKGAEFRLIFFIPSSSSRVATMPTPR